MSRSTIRTIVAVALALFVIGVTAPNVFVSRYTAENSPVIVDSDFNVVGLVPGPEVSASHLKVGDRLDPRSLAVDERSWLLGWALPLEGQTMHFTAQRAGRSFSGLLPEPRPVSGDLAVALIKRTTASVFIIAALILLLMRPSLMMWGFFLYAIGSAEGSPLVLEFLGSTANTIGTVLLAGVIYPILGPLGLLLFATRFPASSPGGARRFIERATPYLGALLVLAAAKFVLNLFGVPLPPVVGIASLLVAICVPLIAMAALVMGFLRLDAQHKQRLRWVVAGFVLYYATVAYQQFAGFLPGQGWPASWTNAGLTIDALNGFVIFIPITVAYAVLKHHVLDINFVIGRGLVYAILTSFAVATFAVIEWLLGGVLAQTKLATAGEVLAAIAMGFGLNGMHARVDRFVDAVIFRKRHAAEQRLARVAAGLPHTESYETIAKLVIREPVDALGLRSGAFFRRSDGGAFHCEYSAAMPAGPQTVIKSDEALLTHLHGERGCVTLRDVGWTFPISADAASAPVIAFPIFVRHELRAIAFYGGHDTGEAIDPDELRALEGLAAGASSALDHVAAAELARRLEEYRQTIEALKDDVRSLRAAQATL